MLGFLLGGIGAAVIGALGTIIGSAIGQKTQREQIASNEEMNQENLDYQKEFNQEVFEREDSAHQREVSDMRKSGLSPFATMNGAGAGGSASSPQNDIASLASSGNNLANLQASLGSDLGSQSSSMMNYLQQEHSLSQGKAIDENRLNLAREEFAWNKTVEAFKQDMQKREMDLADKKYSNDSERLEMEKKLAASKVILETAESESLKQSTHVSRQNEKIDLELKNQELRDMMLEHKDMLDRYSSDVYKRNLENQLKELEIQLKEAETMHAKTKEAQEEKRRTIDNLNQTMKFVNSVLEAISMPLKVLGKF